MLLSSPQGSVWDAFSQSQILSVTAAPFAQTQGMIWSPFFRGTLKFCFFRGDGLRRYLLSARLKPTQVENGRWGAKQKDSFRPQRGRQSFEPVPGMSDATAGKARPGRWSLQTSVPCKGS